MAGTEEGAGTDEGTPGGEDFVRVSDSEGSVDGAVESRDPEWFFPLMTLESIDFDDGFTGDTGE